MFEGVMSLVIDEGEDESKVILMQEDNMSMEISCEGSTCEGGHCQHEC